MDIPKDSERVSFPEKRRHYMLPAQLAMKEYPSVHIHKHHLPIPFGQPGHLFADVTHMTQQVFIRHGFENGFYASRVNVIHCDLCSFS
jgi:hypothetical protein